MKKLFLAFLTLTTLFAQVAFGQSAKRINSLVNNGLYFTALPELYNFLASGRQVDRGLESSIEKIVANVGIRHFQGLPAGMLRKTRSPSLRYALAKKYFFARKYTKALDALNMSIPKSHAIRPFALQLEGSIHYMRKMYEDSVAAFADCMKASKKAMSYYKSANRRRQLEINHDLCLVGIPRAYFTLKDYKKSYSKYLDLGKESYIWPGILLEEAWTSFYLGNYNRTLGKLVTYKAPLLDFIFDPEVDLLRALTYLELCLWDDVKIEVDGFYSKYQRQSKILNRFYKKYRGNYKYFFLLAKSRLGGRARGNSVLNKIVKGIVNDPAYREMYDQFVSGKKEFHLLRQMKQSRQRRILSTYLKRALVTHRNTIGAYVQEHIKKRMDKLNQAFSSMSYIKLEVYSRRKGMLLGGSSNMGRARGKLSNLLITDKQYFWSFNGEFWADELGDYVFSLKGKCN